MKYLIEFELLSTNHLS